MLGELTRRVTICLLLLLAPALHGQRLTKNTAVPKATPDPFEDFQAFTAVVHGGLGNNHNQKIFRSGRFMRVEFDDHYRITDLISRTTMAVAGPRCFKFNAPDARAFPFGVYRDFKIERSPTSEKETVDGHPCSIENVTFTGPTDNPVVVHMKMWRADDLRAFPIKITVEWDGHQSNLAYTDVELKAPDQNLFQHPAKCAIFGGPDEQSGKASTSNPKNPSPRPREQKPQPISKSWAQPT